MPVKLLTKEEVKNNNIKAFLNYKDITFKKDTAYIYYYYAVQGIGIKAKYVLNDCNWNLVDSHLWEN